MFPLLLSFLLLNSATAKLGCPTFNWVSTSKSEQGIPLLNIKYPDNQEVDFAVLKKMNNTSTTDCVLEGHLMLEQNASVKITKTCDTENDFQIEINSHHLVYSTFNVTNGTANPSFPIEGSNSVSGTQISQPFSFPRNGLVLRLEAFYDASFNSKFGKASTVLIEAIIEETQILFSLPSLTLDIKIDLVGVKEINETISTANHDLTSFFETRSSEGENVINSFLFFTGKSFNKDFKNPINVNGSICSTQSKERSAIVSWRSSKAETSKDLAKEVGYLLGMNDDFKWNLDNSKVVTRSDRKGKTCTNINGIMDFSSEHLVWSTCSVEDFLHYYNTVRATQLGGEFCLIEKPTQPKVTVGYSKLAVALGDFLGILDDIEVIDLSSSNTRCQKLRRFPYENSGAVGGLGLGDNPIICGGIKYGSSCHSLQNGSWKPEAALNEGRSSFAMTRSPFPNDGSKLFVTGGWDNSANRLKSSEVLTENGWQFTTPLPVKISSHCMIMINSTSVMVIGGEQGKSGEASGRTFLLDGVTKVWREGPQLKERRDHNCAMIRKDSQSQEKSVIVVGGKDDNWKTLSSTEVFNVGSSVWKSGPKLPFEISEAAMVEDPSGGVVLIGGYNIQEGWFNTLFRLPHAGPGATWEEMPQKLKTGKIKHTAFLIPDELGNCN